MSANNVNNTNTTPISGAIFPPRSQLQNSIPKPYPLPESGYEQTISDPNSFLLKLQRFHAAFGSKFKVPIVGGNALDLHRLFVEVTSRGGVEKVISDRRWKEIIAAFNFAPTMTSASFTLRKYYLSLLYHFEQVYYFRKKFPSSSASDSVNSTGDQPVSQNGTAEGVVMNQLSESSSNEDEDVVSFTIDHKFDDGYIVTAKHGDEVLRGVLFHVPMTTHLTRNTSGLPPARANARSSSQL